MKLLSICIFINASMRVKYYAYALYATEMKKGAMRNEKTDLQPSKYTCTIRDLLVQYFPRNIYIFSIFMHCQTTTTTETTTSQAAEISDFVVIYQTEQPLAMQTESQTCQRTKQVDTSSYLYHPKTSWPFLFHFYLILLFCKTFTTVLNWQMEILAILHKLFFKANA